VIILREIILFTKFSNLDLPLKSTKGNYQVNYVFSLNEIKSLIDTSLPFMIVIDFQYFLDFINIIKTKELNLLILIDRKDLSLVPENLNYKSAHYFTLPKEKDAIIKRIIDQLLMLELKENYNLLSYENLIHDELTLIANIGIAIAKNSTTYFGDNDFNITMNKSFENIYARSQSEICSIGLKNLAYSNDHNIEIEHFRKLKNGEISSYSITKHIIKPDSSVAIIKMHVDKIEYNKNDVTHMCIVQDITDSYTIEAALIESERSKSVLLSHLPGLAYRCKYDPDWTMEFVSKGCYELTGYYAESLLFNRDLAFNDLIAPEYHDLLWEEWKTTLKSHSPFRYQYQIITAKGVRKWVYELGEGIFDENDNVVALEGIIIDIDSQKKFELELKHKSEYDSWTNLHNRSYLEQEIIKDLDTKNYKNRALIGINLTSLQSLTPIYGYYYTQEIMKTISQALKELTKSNHPLFIAYENFLMFYIKKFSIKKDILNLIEKIKTKLGYILNKERVGCGIGVYIFEKDIQDIEQIFKNVIIATEKAISFDSLSISNVFYDVSMKNQILRENLIKKGFNTVIENNNHNKRLYLVYQPILDLKTNKISSFEALSRFNSLKLGELSPLEFIPILEVSKLIIPIGDMIINESLDFIHEINERFDTSTSISINISVIQLISDGFISNLITIINNKKINPSNIILELTETIFSKDFFEINNILNELRSYGIKIVIDDFGTGFSSLSRESELSIDGLKIDKLFIDKINEHNNEQVLTSDIISMSHKLNHIVVAEGVEHEYQKKYLIDNNCDKLQGFLFSKPLKKENAITFYEKHFKKGVQ